MSIFTKKCNSFQLPAQTSASESFATLLMKRKSAPESGCLRNSRMDAAEKITFNVAVMRTDGE